MVDITNTRARATDPSEPRPVSPLVELAALFRFYDPHVADAAGGFNWLDAAGLPMPSKPKALWLNARFTYSYALAELLGHTGARGMVEHGLNFLDGPIRDRQRGGWYASQGADEAKEAYGQAHVVLATAAAIQAGHVRAEPILHDALAAGFKFFDPGQGLFGDVFTADWGHLDDYRGANSNMHMVEALLAASVATDDPALHDVAVGVLDRVLGEFAAQNRWRVPEHFTAGWEPLPEYNRSNPRNPFRPYGFTIGHSFEWARLSVNAWSASGRQEDRHLSRATHLYDRALEEGLQGDQLVFTVDGAGNPFDRDRYHWPVAEAISAAAALRKATGDPRYERDASTFWRIAARDFIDREHGGWIHQLDESGAVSTTVWEGKPDLYHALQACLMGDLPLAPDVASALRGRNFKGSLDARTRMR